MTPIHYLKGIKLLSYRGYLVMMVACWVYALLWVGALVAMWYYWDALSIYLKIVLFLILLFGTPTISDLTESYQKYKEQWKQDNSEPGEK